VLSSARPHPAAFSVAHLLVRHRALVPHRAGWASRFAARGSSVAPLATRIDRARRAMSGLSPHLPPGMRECRDEAARSEVTLRESVARIVAVERALSMTPPDMQPLLSAARDALRAEVTEGVLAYERLVGAAAQCVAADAAPDGMAARSLVEAGDHLIGAARALGELTRRVGALT
jgi:hypothetical protein